MKDYRIFAIDLLSEPGKSYKTADFNNIDEITELYQEVLWALKLDSFHLIGASRGGWFAVDLAAKSKRDIKSLVLLSPAQTFMWIPPSTDLIKNIINALSSDEKKLERELETMSNNVNAINKNYLKQYRIGVKNDTLPKFMMQMTPFPNKSLQTLKMPTLVLIGDDDVINGKKTLGVVKRNISSSHAEVVPNAGHFVTVDQAEVVNKKILNFLNNVDKAE